MNETPKILHCHSTFSAGGKEVRCAKLINAFGKGLSHHIVSAMPERMGASDLIDRAHTQVSYPTDFPSLSGSSTPGRLATIAQAMKPYDLILTYNWGAMDAVMAHTIFGRHYGLAPLIHHEDGFNEDEADELKWTRNWFRRIALTHTDALVVPSTTLEKSIALTEVVPAGLVRSATFSVSVPSSTWSSWSSRSNAQVESKAEMVSTSSGSSSPIPNAASSLNTRPTWW